ncbi:MAG: TolC family protein [Armatimonadota bacterium]
MRIPLACLAIFVTVTAAQAQPLSIVQAVETAMTNRPSLVRAKLAVQSAKDGVTQASSAYYPEVTTGGQYTYQRTRSDVTGAGSNVGVMDQTDASIDASIKLFDLGQRNWSVSSSKRGYESALEAYREEKQQTILAVSQAYMNAYLYKRVYDVRTQQLERTLKESELIRAQVAEGASARTNLLQAEASAANAQVALLQADTDAQTAMTNLAVTMGLGAKEQWELTLPAVFGNMRSNTPEAVLNLRGSTPAEQLKVALANRPDMRMSRLSAEMSRLSYRTTAANSGVTVSGNASTSYNFSPGDSDSGTVMVMANIPVFDAGSSKATKDIAKANYDSSVQNIRTTELQVMSELENYRLERKNAALRLTAAETALKVSQSNYDSAQESLKEGVGTIVEVLTARAAYTDAEVNLAQAQSDNTMSMIKWQIALGEDDVITSDK